MESQSLKLLRLGTVCERAGLGKSKIYSLIKEKKFPAPIRIGGAARWVEQDVDAALQAFVVEHGHDDGTGSSA